MKCATYGLDYVEGRIRGQCTTRPDERADVRRIGGRQTGVHGGADETASPGYEQTHRDTLGCPARTKLSQL